jgi:hypothetical protein
MTLLLVVGMVLLALGLPWWWWRLHRSAPLPLHHPPMRVLL